MNAMIADFLMDDMKTESDGRISFSPKNVNYIFFQLGKLCEIERSAPPKTLADLMIEPRK